VIIHDLKKRLAGVSLVVSPPIINIRESCDLLPALEEGKERRIPPSVTNTNKIYAKV
jgi:singapore isolate B (sub-type 7) whole genome shotgun sequence assembly, scaffold_3